MDRIPAPGHRRWRSQLLAPDDRRDDPVEVVRWMGALQAQDHGQSLWAIASRLREPSVAAVEAAADAGAIVRTWPMRGTIHWVPAAAGPDGDRAPDPAGPARTDRRHRRPGS